MATELEMPQQPSEILGRNGGDEFVLFLTTAERAANALAIADGGDRSTTFDIRHAQRATELQAQTDLVRSSLDDGRLTMAYQPVVNDVGAPVGVAIVSYDQATPATKPA